MRDQKRHEDRPEEGDLRDREPLPKIPEEQSPPAGGSLQRLSLDIVTNQIGWIA